MRPRQWVKNLLVYAAPVAANRFTDGEVMAQATLAFVSFCLASSAVYLVNDCVDRASDALHPVKRHRAIASGRLSVSQALTAAVVLGAASLGLAAIASWQTAVLMAGYLILQAAYSVRLKHEPVLDLAIVASGFVLRAVAGGIASDLAISQWFLLVTGFGSLFVVAGKRYSELHTVGAEAATRRSLVHYRDSYLRFVWTLGAGASIVCYSLWAFEVAGGGWAEASIAPMVLAIMRYSMHVDAGEAEAPEEIVFSDHTLQVLALITLILLVLGVARA